MEEQYITFETAKIAKEKKFIYPTLANYECEEDGTVKELNWKFKTLEDFLDNLNTPVCTQSLLQGWLRKVHNIHIQIIFLTLNNRYVFAIYKHGEDDIESVLEYETYELALEAALQEALKLI